MRTAIVRAAALLLVLPFAPAAKMAADPEQYRIHTRSPESWAHYYELIGLGKVHRGPMSRAAWTELTGHCEVLEDLTGFIWIPLGYSIQRGYKLCFRTGPFSANEAKTFCARLVMYVLENGRERIVCERDRPVDYRRLNPWLR